MVRYKCKPTGYKKIQKVLSKCLGGCCKVSPLHYVYVFFVDQNASFEIVKIVGYKCKQTGYKMFWNFLGSKNKELSGGLPWSYIPNLNFIFNSSTLKLHMWYDKLI